MAVYFASDMHLRLDRPSRGDRLARWVGTLDPAHDTVYLVGDVCDFWFVARQCRGGGPLACPGLRALADFRARGGGLTALPGNHDQWMGPFYERHLGARFVGEPLEVEAHGLRFHVTHGHRAGGRPPWKSGMESRAFLSAFEALPGAVAGRLDRLLEGTNDRRREADERRVIPVFRSYLTRLEGAADVAVFGHIHSPLDDPASRPRMVILGGWHHQSSYLRVDDRGAALVVEPDPAPAPERPESPGVPR